LSAICSRTGRFVGCVSSIGGICSCYGLSENGRTCCPSSVAGTPGCASPVRTWCAPPRPAPRPASPGRRRPPPTPAAGSQPPLGASSASRSTSPLRTDGKTVGHPGHPLRKPPPDASPPDEPASLRSFARTSSPRRTISWADEGGTPVAGGRRSDSAPPRVKGQDGNARELNDGDSVTVKCLLAAPAVQLVAGGSSGQRARLRLGRQPLGSDRAVAQMQAAVAPTDAGGMHMRSAAAPPLADGEPSLAGVGAAAAAPPPVSAALREPTTPVELTTPSTSSVFPLLQLPSPGGASNDGHDAQAANQPRNPTATTTASAKEPSTLTVTRSVGKRVAETAAAAAAPEDEEPGTLPRKRRVGMRSTAARPPVMPKPKPTGEAKPPSTRPSVKAAPDNSPCRLYVDGGRRVAAGRLLKSQRVLHGRAVDADLVVVCVLSVWAGMHLYPYQTQLPPPFQQRSKLRMADVLQTLIVWSRALVQALSCPCKVSLSCSVQEFHMSRITMLFYDTWFVIVLPRKPRTFCRCASLWSNRPTPAPHSALAPLPLPPASPLTTSLPPLPVASAATPGSSSGLVQWLGGRAIAQRRRQAHCGPRTRGSDWAIATALSSDGCRGGEADKKAGGKNLVAQEPEGTVKTGGRGPGDRGR